MDSILRESTGQHILVNDVRFNSNSNRVANKASLKKVIEDVFQTLNSNQIIERLEEANIANARLNTVKEFMNHPQLKARNRWREVESPVGTLKALLPPVTFDQIDSVMKPIPSVGQHTEAILEEFGFDREIMKKCKVEEEGSKVV